MLTTREELIYWAAFNYGQAIQKAAYDDAYSRARAMHLEVDEWSLTPRDRVEFYLRHVVWAFPGAPQTMREKWYYLYQQARRSNWRGEAGGQREPFLEKLVFELTAFIPAPPEPRVRAKKWNPKRRVGCPEWLYAVECGPEGIALRCACGFHNYIPVERPGTHREPTELFGKAISVLVADTQTYTCPQCGHPQTTSARLVDCASPDHNDGCSNPNCWKHKN